MAGLESILNNVKAWLHSASYQQVRLLLVVWWEYFIVYFFEHTSKVYLMKWSWVYILCLKRLSSTEPEGVHADLAFKAITD